MFNKKIFLITGGTGSFGNACVKELLTNYNPEVVRIFSRDELKQWEMRLFFQKYPKFSKLRFFIGDVRDKDRLKRAFDSVDYVIHAAALKQVQACEYNPAEAIKTNIDGAMNVIDAAIDCGVKKIIALSTDKAAAPANLYGATKLCSDKLFIAANTMKGAHKTIFSVARCGNVFGSRGSVVPLFLEKRKEGILPITDPEMTRFNISLEDDVKFVLFALKNAFGGEIFVPKLPSYKIIDLAKAIDPICKLKIIGIRPGEKIHEELITESDSLNTIELDKYYIILPTSPFLSPKKIRKKYQEEGKYVKKGFSYNSKENNQWLSVNQLKKLIKNYLKQNQLKNENYPL